MCQPDDAAQTVLEASQASQAAASRTFRLTVAYDGADFFGWQRQASARTVQQTLEDAIAQVTGAPRVHLLASSRTDAGVHAIGQCATFRSTHWKHAADHLPFALNTHLPDDVIVRAACEVPASFHPIRDAVGKRYRYTVYASRVANPLGRRLAWWVKRPLDIEAMRRSAECLVGRHDFVSFQSVGSPRVSTVRHVKSIEIRCARSLDGQDVSIEIEADGFLYNMVRNIVGTLVQVGRGSQTVEWVEEVLRGGDRTRAGQTAPAHGLCLLEIYFDNPARFDSNAFSER